MGLDKAEASHREFPHRLGHAAQFLHARNSTPNIAGILRQIILKVTMLGRGVLLWCDHSTVSHLFAVPTMLMKPVPYTAELAVIALLSQFSPRLTDVAASLL